MRSGLAAALLIGTAVSAIADDGPVVAIPGRPEVPVIVAGRDASYAVIESDWGLAKNVRLEPTVYGGYAPYPERVVGRYFPSAGQLPGYGRLEIEPPPNRALPPRAESYRRSWTAESAPPLPPQAPAYPPPYYDAQPPLNEPSLPPPRPRPQRR